MTKITIPHEDWLEEYVNVLDSRLKKRKGEDSRLKKRKGEDTDEDIFGEDTPEDALPEVVEQEAPEEEFVGVHKNHLSQVRSIYGRRNYIGRTSFTGQFGEVGE